MSLSAKLSVPLPPSRLSKLLKLRIVPPVVNVPLAGPLIVHALAASGPCRLFTVAAGAVTTSIFANPPAILASVPLNPSVAPKAVSTTLRAVVYADKSSVSLPAPPSIEPPNTTVSLSAKLSVPLPPVRACICTNVVIPAVVAILPASAPARVHAALPTDWIVFVPKPPSIAVAPVS